ncbi:MAG: alpha/beta hydrolase-fold protein [Planctomycetota bacterium]
MMPSFAHSLPILIFLLCFTASEITTAQTQQTAKKKKPAPFQWVNPSKTQTPNLAHATFRSPSMGIDVGYFIYLPKAYNWKANSKKRFPVVYYLHGGRPGSEKKSISLASFVHKATQAKSISPTIYVFINGGPVSHYNYPEKENAMGEDVFIKELIPHVDATYRTVADRSGRGIEGFSQGGRGTMRIIMKHPDLFCSAAPGGGGYATEKKISESGGRESDTLKFAEGYNTWDLAEAYAKQRRVGSAADFKLLVFVGTKGFNYENNLEFMDYLTSLQIPFEKLVVPEAPHSAKVIYEKNGSDILEFHQKNFGAH